VWLDGFRNVEFLVGGEALDWTLLRER